MPFLSGYQASVTLASTAYAFRKWKATMKNGLCKVTNFTGNGYQQMINGITSATITLEGPYDQGSMPLIVGNTYTFVLGFTSSVSISISAVVGELSPEVDIEKEQIINVTCESSGSFNASVN